jgi:hypothetical protein
LALQKSATASKMPVEENPFVETIHVYQYCRIQGLLCVAVVTIGCYLLDEHFLEPHNVAAALVAQGIMRTDFADQAPFVH